MFPKNIRTTAPQINIEFSIFTWSETLHHPQEISRSLRNKKNTWFEENSFKLSVCFRLSCRVHWHNGDTQFLISAKLRMIYILNKHFVVINKKYCINKAAVKPNICWQRCKVELIKDRRSRFLYYIGKFKHEDWT